MKGIEPSCPAWEAGVLPLNYTRIGKEEMVMAERRKVKKAITKVKGYCAPKAAKLPAAQLFR